MSLLIEVPRTDTALRIEERHYEKAPGHHVAREKLPVPEPITNAAESRRMGAKGEVPFFFPSAGRPLYGAFHPADIVDGAKAVVVFCHAIGTEHMLTQRIEVQGARTAASAGFPAFRYNARAHGDSAGEQKELTFTDLVDDACAAADMARELSGASHIVWVGIRFGCLVAAQAMRRRADTVAIGLWEPLHRGIDYFRSLARATFFKNVVEGRRSGVTVENMLEQLEREGELPVVAAFVYRSLFRSARDADLAQSLQNWNGDTLIAQIESRHRLSEDNQCLRSALEQRQGAKVTVAMITQEPAWGMLPISRPQWTSEALLEATKEWLRSLE
jgi:alpha/beta superfamily hydrolase